MYMYSKQNNLNIKGKMRAVFRKHEAHGVRLPVCQSNSKQDATRYESDVSDILTINE